MTNITNIKFKKYITPTYIAIFISASLLSYVQYNFVYAEKSDVVAEPITLPEIKRLTNVEIEHDATFSKGICPNGDNDIDNLTLISAINKRDSVKDYVPPNLVEITNKVRTKGGRKICLEETTAVNLKKMFDDAKKSKLNIIVTSGYRSPQVQLYLFNNAISKNGYRGTLRVAPPFHSEHHLNAVDLTSLRIKGDSASSSFGQTPEGKWMALNAWKYGFVQSYPKGKETITGYVAEDWHWRFIGKDNAKLAKDTGLTFHELVTSESTQPRGFKTFTQKNSNEKKKKSDVQVAG